MFESKNNNISILKIIMQHWNFYYAFWILEIKQDSLFESKICYSNCENILFESKNQYLNLEIVIQSENDI